MSGAAAKLRLDRLLANLGYGSRREVQQLVLAGLVSLNGAVLADPQQRLSLDADLPARMTVQGRPLDPIPGMVVLMHKPLGATCSHKEAGTLVYDLLPPRWRGREPALSTIGRLDKETSGLLLFTDDGGLLHRVISPRNHVAKRYRAELARPLRGDEGLLFASGTLLLEGEDKPLMPATLQPLSPTTAWLTVTEGRYHQVRRMFAAAGNHVVALHRDGVGALELPADLQPGDHRLIGPEQVADIFRDAGANR